MTASVVAPHLIGESLLARDERGRLLTRIATVFPRSNTIVTLPGIHATQRIAYTDALNHIRMARGLPALTEEAEEAEWDLAVDLILEEDTVLIRPDCSNMALAFEADELLQQVISKKNVRFLNVLDDRVREAIKRRGERWRISPLPRSVAQMSQMIAASRISIVGRDIYYYNPSSGTRLLTYSEFAGLGRLGSEGLRSHLAEIRAFAPRTNRMGSPEIAFFMADDPTLVEAFAPHDFTTMEPGRLEEAYESLLRRFHDAVRPEFRQDDPHAPEWRGQMYAALVGRTDKSVGEESLLGLGAEFFMQIEWLPGGRIEDGELLLDTLFEDEQANGRCPPNERLCDPKARGFIFNFIRDYGDLEYVNVGRVVDSLSHRLGSPGRRGVYLAEFKHRATERPILRIIRMQKFGVSEHLDEGKDLLTSIVESEDYTEYVLDRRLGCRQLGMNLSPRTSARKIREQYAGRNTRYQGAQVWSAYFERDYLAGLATDKIPAARFADAAFALPFARALGAAAAPNLIVGRCGLEGNVVFDDGDELLVEDEHGVPVNVLVADHTSTFVDYRRDLLQLAPAYAESVTSRVGSLGDVRAFGEVFVDAFLQRFSQIQQEYRKRRRAFDTLFKHEVRDEAGSFAYRWERVLARLHAADANALAQSIRDRLARA